MPNVAHRTTEGMTKRIEELIRQPTVPPKEGLVGREAILAALARAADEPKPLRSLADNPHEALKEYYALTSEERTALASGDIQKIESWVGKLDKRLATWLWCRLCQENKISSSHIHTSPLSFAAKPSMLSIERPP